MMTFRGYWALTIGILAGLGSISFASKFLLVMFIFMFTLIILSIINIYIIKSTIHTTRIVLPEKPDEETEILTTLRIKGATADTILKDYFDNGKKMQNSLIKHLKMPFRKHNINFVQNKEVTSQLVLY